MNIAILGAGHVGCVLAADLTLKGHSISLIKTSHALHDSVFTAIQNNDNKITFKNGKKTQVAKITKVSRDFSDISGAELVIITIQTNYHEALIEKIAKYVSKDQILMFLPGYLSTAYVLSNAKLKNNTVIECESSFIDSRVELVDGKAVSTVSFINVLNPLGVYPKENIPLVKRKLKALSYPFAYLKSVVEAALHNPNLIVHTIGAIMSIPRIEYSKGNYCMYKEVFTPSVWNLLEVLDAEKMAVLGKLGFKKLSYVNACKERNSLDKSSDAKAVFFEYANSPTVVPGPSIVDSRYITEDVSQGLVMLESLGKHLKVATPICSSLIDIASASLCRDFRAEGRTLAKLKKKNLETILS